MKHYHKGNADCECDTPPDRLELEVELIALRAAMAMLAKWFSVIEGMGGEAFDMIMQQLMQSAPSSSAETSLSLSSASPVDSDA